MPSRMNQEQQRAQISALADGQLRGEAFAQAVQQVCSGGDAQASWQVYHVVGDVLRSAEALPVRADGADFAARVLARLQQEDALLAAPVANDAGVCVRASASEADVASARVLAQPHVGPAPGGRRRRWRMLAGATSLATLALLGWGLDRILWPATDAERLAQLPTTVMPMPLSGPQPMLRDPRLDELLAAHKQLGGHSALPTPVGFLRNAAVDGGGH